MTPEERAARLAADLGIEPVGQGAKDVALIATAIRESLAADRETVAAMILFHAARRDPDGHPDDISDRAARRLVDVVLDRRKP
jgi:hypothetical protein